MEARVIGVHAVRPEAVCGEIDRACREIIEAAGHGARFGYRAGTGPGPEVHEAPRVARGSSSVLRVGCP